MVVLEELAEDAPQVALCPLYTTDAADDLTRLGRGRRRNV